MKFNINLSLPEPATIPPPSLNVTVEFDEAKSKTSDTAQSESARQEIKISVRKVNQRLRSRSN